MEDIAVLGLAQICEVVGLDGLEVFSGRGVADGGGDAGGDEGFVALRMRFVEGEVDVGVRDVESKGFAGRVVAAGALVN